MGDVSTRYRSTRTTTNYLAKLVCAHLRYPAVLAPANDRDRLSPRARRRARLTPGEINERLLALLCMCLAGSISILWLVINLRG